MKREPSRHTNSFLAQAEDGLSGEQCQRQLTCSDQPVAIAHKGSERHRDVESDLGDPTLSAGRASTRPQGFTTALTPPFPARSGNRWGSMAHRQPIWKCCSAPAPWEDPGSQLAVPISTGDRLRPAVGLRKGVPPSGGLHWGLVTRDNSRCGCWTFLTDRRCSHQPGHLRPPQVSGGESPGRRRRAAWCRTWFSAWSPTGC